MMGIMQKELSNLFHQILNQYEKLQPTIDKRSLEELYFSTRSPQALIKHVAKVFGQFASRVEILQRQSRSSSDYQQLQKALQTQQAQIRNHIRLEQQMKLYAESIQSKLEETDKKLKDAQGLFRTMEALKCQNQKLQQECRVLKQRSQNSIPTESSLCLGKGRHYINRYDTQNKSKPKSPFKQISGVAHNISSANIQKSYVATEGHHKTYHEDSHNKSASRDDLRKLPSKVGSIHLFSKKNSTFSTKK